MNKKVFSSPMFLLIVFGLINLFSSGRWTIAAATWIAPIFALRYLAVSTHKRRRLYFFLVLWLSMAIPWYGATPIFGPAHFIFMAVQALIGVIPIVVHRLLVPRLRHNGRLPFVSTLIFPLAGTVLEFISSSANPIGNFGAAGYSQFGVPVLTQITAVTGMLGLTFLVAWFPAIVDWAWDNEFAWTRIRTGVIAFAVTMVVVIGYGTARLATAPEVGSQETVRVASFTLTEIHVGELFNLLEEEGVDAYRQTTQAIHEQYLQMTETAIADGAKIIVWPELALIGVEEDVQAAIVQGQTLAEAGGVYLAMPVFIAFPNSDRTMENKLFVAGPDGRIVYEHVKYGGNILEGTVKGSGEIQVIETPYGNLAGIICWDTDYPNIVTQVGQQQTDILLSPAKDWEGINPIHAEMAVFRAIENGTAVIRQSDEGMSIVVDGYGRTLATGEGLVDNGNYLITEVPTTSPTTLYPVVGDVVGILATVSLVGLAIYAWLLGRRNQEELLETAVVTP